MADLYEWMTTTTKEGKEVVFALDKEGRLYVNSERVITEQKVSLDWWINIAVVLGALGAFAQGMVAILSLY